MCPSGQLDMPLRKISRFLLLFLLVATPFLQSCSEDTIDGGTTAINGRVITPSGDPIDDVGAVVEYSTVAAGAAPALPQTADGKVVLKAPYPNPSATGVVYVPIQVDTDTTLRVEVLAPVQGGLQVVETLKNGLVTEDTLLTWDGFDVNNVFPLATFVPNGMVRIRVTVPAAGGQPVQLEMPVLVNQPASINVAQGTWNAVSLFGEYTITDIPVGEYYTGTQANGIVRGRERVSETVILSLDADNYEPRDVPLVITPGDVVSITTTLTPILSSIQPTD